MQTIPQPKTKTNSRPGVTVVEFALVAPLLFLVIFGAIEFSQVNMIRN
ncbi:MAG: pilus assembly protein, partial [Planctomycetaceae bacterium]|nr:pilus assembly protein [Planctomycetaceae bacterium]